MAFERSKLALSYVGEATGLSTRISQAGLFRKPHIVDQLIEERGGRLVNSMAWPVLRPFLYAALHYKEAVSMADDAVGLSGKKCMERISDRLQLDVRTRGADNIPASGAFILVCNHPTGIADGVAMWDAMERSRPDVAVFANRDAVRVNPRLDEVIIPVEWREGHKTRDKSRETLRLTNEAIRQEKAILIFPSGRIAFWDEGKLTERPWQASALMLARKYGLPIVPAHMASRNSGLFYFLSKWSSELRDMTVFHELLNKTDTQFEITFGQRIETENLVGDTQELTDRLQAFCTRDLAANPSAVFHAD